MKTWKRVLPILLSLSLLFAIIPPLSAQATPDCSSAAFARLLERHAQLVTGAVTFGTQWVAAQAAISAFGTECFGLTFHGDTGGTVVGPVDIPEGIYRVRLTGKNTQLDLRLAAGNCETPYMYTTADAQSDEEVFYSWGCRAMLEMGMGGAWDVTFTPVQ